MNMQDEYAISYPLLSQHPLRNRAPKIRAQYIWLLNYFRRKYCSGNSAVKARLQRFSSNLLPEGLPTIPFLRKWVRRMCTTKQDIEKMQLRYSITAITRERFSGLNPYSLRYIFLFDCIFLLAPDDPDLAVRICDEINRNSNISIFKKRMQRLEKGMFSLEIGNQKWDLVSEEQWKNWYDTRRYLTMSKRTIVFTATMSAGKSTLINAVMGQELAFAKKAACTASVMEFQSVPTYQTQYNVIGQDQILTNISAEEVKNYTKGQENPCIVSSYFESRINKAKVSIFDTPGVNSSRNPKHKEITKSMLLNGKKDIIVYVIPVENYGAEDDYVHLQFIRQKVSYNKIIFVINMMDTCDFEDDSVKEIVDNITNHLLSLGYENPIICPVSAKAGLLFKKVLSGNTLTANEEKMMKALYDLFQDPDYDLTGCYKKLPGENFCFDSYKYTQISKEDMYQVYLKTGIPQFEEILYRFIKEE